MDELSGQYLAWCTAEGVPANTVASRARVLRSLGNAATATRADVETWWATRRGLSRATRTNDLANLRGFYRWASRWEHRNDDPTARLDAPKVDRGLPRPISRHDLHQLLDKLPDDLRRAVCLGAYAGLRVSEAARLDWHDVDQETLQLRVTASKGFKSRAVRISPVLLDQLLPDTGRNVVTGTSKAATPASLQRRVNRAIQAAGVEATFHQLRHRFGVVAYQATGDILAVGKAMGHSSPVTTAVYAQANDDVAAKIAAAVVR